MANEMTCRGCGQPWTADHNCPGRLPTLHYVRQLEDAVLMLWAELPIEEQKMLVVEAPRLMDFCAHLHHSIEHEQAMTRRNVWAEA